MCEGLASRPGEVVLVRVGQDWVGPRYGLGAVAKGKICFLAENKNSSTAVHFVEQSL